MTYPMITCRHKTRDCISTNVVIYRKMKIIKTLPQRQAHVHRCLVGLQSSSPLQDRKIFRYTEGKKLLLAQSRTYRPRHWSQIQASVAHNMVPLHIYRMTMLLRSNNSHKKKAHTLQESAEQHNPKLCMFIAVKHPFISLLQVLAFIKVWEGLKVQKLSQSPRMHLQNMHACRAHADLY